MPYADITQQRATQREWHHTEYHSNPKFRRKELKRKKEARRGWKTKRRDHNAVYMRTYMRGYRARKAAERAKAQG